MPDTIFALSSGRPPAAISVIRISGLAALDAATRLAGALPEPRMAAVRELRDPSSGELLDEALVLRFDGPASSTGENIVEFQCHGGRAVIDAVLAALTSVEGLRPAEPGEFTRRAFENGRIDLTEAEGLADLIEAETESQRRAAVQLADGGLKKQVADWQTRLLGLLAQAELAIDYDEDDALDPKLAGDCAGLAAERREAEGRYPGRGRGPSQHWKVQPDQCDSWRRAFNRHGRPRDYARSYRGAAVVRRSAGAANRYGGPASNG